MNEPVHALVEALRAGIAEAADPERAPRMQAYMKSEMPFRGVSAVPLRRVYRGVFARHRLEGRTSWEAAVRTLWDEASFREERYAAVALTGHRYYREHQDLTTLDLYRHLVVTGAWWDFVDDIAAHRIGPLLAAFPTPMTPVVRSWAGDDDLWVRRTAILCQLARKEATDPALLAEVVEANLEGTVFGGEFFIRKAIGWGLRAYAWVDPAAVVAYCESHGLSGLSRREALKNVRP